MIFTRNRNAAMGDNSMYCMILVWHRRPLPNDVLGKGSGIMQYIELSQWNFIIANHCVY